VFQILTYGNFGVALAGVEGGDVGGEGREGEKEKEQAETRNGRRRD
jgi:hypothetical protein